MRSGQKINLSGKRSYLVKTTSVNTSALHEPSADDFLLHLVEDFANLLVDVGETLFKCGDYLVSDNAYSLVTNVLVISIKRILELFKSHFLNSVI